MRSKELVQLAGDLIRLALSAVSAECLSDIYSFLALPLSSYTALCRLMQRSVERILIQGYTSAPTERPCMSRFLYLFLHCDADEQFNCHEGRALPLRSRHNTCPRSGRVTTRGPFLRFDDLRRR